MTDPDESDIAADRRVYAEHASRFWAMLREGDSTKANRESKQSAEIARRWAAELRVDELLSPLLLHVEEAVRYAAAADLVVHTKSEAAVQVLREIARNPAGLIAPTAKLFLMKNRLTL